MATINLCCKTCGSIMELDEEETMIQCPHCGSAELFEISDDVRIAKIEADTYKAKLAHEREKAKEDERSFFKAMKGALMLMIGIPAVIMFFVFVSEIGDTKIPVASRNCINKNYIEIANAFRDAGFFRVETEALGDLVDGFMSNKSGDVGKVKKITVNGNESFRDGTTVKSWNVIRIYYHTYPDTSP